MYQQSNPSHTTHSSHTVSTTPRSSLRTPELHVASKDGYLYDTADAGSLVRIAADPDSAPMQILISDENNGRGEPLTLYKYVLTGQDAEIVSIKLSSKITK